MRSFHILFIEQAALEKTWFKAKSGVCVINTDFVHLYDRYIILILSFAYMSTLVAGLKRRRSKRLKVHLPRKRSPLKNITKENTKKVMKKSHWYGFEHIRIKNLKHLRNSV